MQKKYTLKNNFAAEVFSCICDFRKKYNYNDDIKLLVSSELEEEIKMLNYICDFRREYNYNDDIKSLVSSELEEKINIICKQYNNSLNYDVDCSLNKNDIIVKFL